MPISADACRTTANRPAENTRESAKRVLFVARDRSSWLAVGSASVPGGRGVSDVRDSPRIRESANQSGSRPRLPCVFRMREACGLQTAGTPWLIKTCPRARREVRKNCAHAETSGSGRTGLGRLGRTKWEERAVRLCAFWGRIQWGFEVRIVCRRRFRGTLCTPLGRSSRHPTNLCNRTLAIGLGGTLVDFPCKSDLLNVSKFVSY